jgi:hypothetical protein
VWLPRRRSAARLRDGGVHGQASGAARQARQRPLRRFSNPRACPPALLPLSPPRSLGTCLFFSLLCCATLGVRRPASARGALHTRSFGILLPLWAGLVALSFLPSNAALTAYFQAARAGGALFLLLQLVILLDIVYGSNERWLAADDGCSRAKLVTGALAANAGTVAGESRARGARWCRRCAVTHALTHSLIVLLFVFAQGLFAYMCT